jgi:hypothetical protein
MQLLQLQAEAEGAAAPRVFFNKEARALNGFVVGLLCGLCTCAYEKTIARVYN